MWPKPAIKRNVLGIRDLAIDFTEFLTLKGIDSNLLSEVERLLDFFLLHALNSEAGKAARHGLRVHLNRAHSLTTPFFTYQIVGMWSEKLENH